MKKHIKIYPEKETYIGRRKLVYYVCEENNEDEEKRASRLRETAKNRRIAIMRTTGAGTIKYYDSIKEAAEDSGLSYSSVSKCVNGKQKSAGGFIFKRRT